MNASLGGFAALSPLSRKLALKIAPGGVVCSFACYLVPVYGRSCNVLYRYFDVLEYLWVIYPYRPTTLIAWLPRLSNSGG